MNALRRLLEFYRVQVELIWNWRRGRRQLLVRAVVSFVVAFVSLAATGALLPGVTFVSPLSIALSVVFIGLLAALVRPVLLAIVAPHSLVLMLLGSLAFQVWSILLLETFVPGVRLAHPSTPSSPRSHSP